MLKRTLTAGLTAALLLMAPGAAIATGPNKTGCQHHCGNTTNGGGGGRSNSQQNQQQQQQQQDQNQEQCQAIALGCNDEPLIVIDGLS